MSLISALLKSGMRGLSVKNKADKKLLHLAAVAVDKTLVRTLTCDGWGEYRVISKNQGSDSKSLDDLISGAVEWNPLSNSEQAFDLMVELKFRVEHVYAYKQQVMVGDGEYWAIVPYDGDPLAATRRAIVMAAAKLAEGRYGH